MKNNKDGEPVTIHVTEMYSVMQVLSLKSEDMREEVMDAGADGYIDKADGNVLEKIEEAIVEHLKE